jgi:hypothetical protein
MGDEDDRLAHLVLDAQELVLQTIAGDAVDGAEGLVHQQHRRIHAERASDADALPLAARKLVRVALREPVGFEPHQLQQLVYARARPSPVPAQQPGHCRHVLGDGQVRKEPDLLDDVAHAEAKLHRVDVGDVLLIVEDAAAGRLDHPVDHLQRRRLAAAGGSDQGAGLAGRDLEAQLVHRHLTVCIALADVLETEHGPP